MFYNVLQRFSIYYDRGRLHWKVLLLFQMKIRSASWNCQKLWWSRWLLWCHSGLEWWWTSTLPLKSESEGLISFQAEWVAMHLQVFWKARSTFAQRLCQRQVQQVLKRQFGGNNISWKVVSVPKQKPGCVTFCDGNNPVSGLMQPNCRNWCPATTLGINLLGVVWSGSTPPGNSFNFFQFIGSISAFYNKLVHSLMIIWWSS